MPSLLCLLGGLISLAILALVLYVLWWAFNKILTGVFEVTMPPKIVVLLQVIGVLLLVYAIVQLVYTGACGFLPGWPRVR